MKQNIQVIILFVIIFSAFNLNAQNFGGGNNDGYSAGSFSFNMPDIDEAFRVENVSSSTINGVYGISDEILITVEFNEPAFITGTPLILLEIGTTDRYAEYSSGNGNSIIIFTYTIQTGDISDDLAYVSTNAIDLNGGTITNALGENANLTLAIPADIYSLSNNKDIEIDGIIPTLEITQAIGQLDPTNSSPINFTATFSEDVVDFTSEDVTIGGTSGATTVIITGGNRIFNLAVSGMVNDGTVIVSIANDVCTDAGGNGNTASANTDNTVTYNSSNPTVEITQAVGQSDPTNGSPINFTATFSEDVAGFINSDVSLSGTAGATAIVVTGGNRIFNLAVSGMVNDGTVIVNIANDVCTDAGGNGNTASANTDNTVTYNIGRPDVEITLANGQLNPTNGSPINFTATFTEDVVGFTSGDVNISGTSGASSIGLSGGPSVYNLSVDGMTNDGTVIVSIASNVCTDASSNGNNSSINTGNEVVYDTKRPEIEIVPEVGQNNPTSNNVISFAAKFTEQVENFTPLHVVISGTTGANNVNLRGGPLDYTIDVSGMTTAGMVIISIAENLMTDKAGNLNTQSVNTGNQIEYLGQNQAPVVPDQVFNIREDSQAGTVIGTVVATDNEGDNISFEIIDGNFDDAFAINQTLGEISLNASNILNIENAPSYSLTVNVEDDAIESQSAQCIVTINVTESENPFVANNVFTPNDDRNKYWLIQNVHLYENYELVIRSGTGQVVYKTISYKNDWNGTYNNKILPTGTYYFSLVNKTNAKVYSGFINLIRN